MGKTLLTLPPGIFVKALDIKTKKWRNSSTGSGPAGKRHVKKLRRHLIRTYKKKHDVSALPKGSATFAAASTRIESSAETAVLLLLPQDEDGAVFGALSTRRKASRKAVGSSVTPRKHVQTLLYHAASTDEKASFDLINARKTTKKAVPAVARVRSGGRLKLRGVFLEALGVAILPRLDPTMVETLEGMGAHVIPNSQLFFRQPEAQALEQAQAVQPDFWHRRILPAAGAAPQTYTGKGISIGVLDTGIDGTHPEFSHHAKVVYGEFDSLGLLQKGKPTRDFGDHGTHVSGICAGQRAGIAPQAHLSVAAVLTEKTDDGQHTGTLAQIIAGFNWLAQSAGPLGQGVDIINASLGTADLVGSDVRAFLNAVTGAVTSGSVVVAAIGNNGEAGIGNHSFPARFHHVIGVGAIDADDRIAVFSDWGPTHAHPNATSLNKPDIVAPGVDINSALPGNRYGLMSGTSMATPVISGAIAVLMEANGELRRRPARLAEALYSFTEQKGNLSHSAPLKVGRGGVTLASLA